MDKRIAIGIGAGILTILLIGGVVWYLRSQSTAELTARDQGQGRNTTATTTGTTNVTKPTNQGAVQQPQELKGPKFEPGKREEAPANPSPEQAKKNLAELQARLNTEYASSVRAELRTETAPSTTSATAETPVTATTSPISAFDPDSDGLTNNQELQINTDPNNPDTDNDGLKDGEEVNLYKTDPTKPDTDNDSYTDGQEVKSGYNPLGSGKCTVSSCIP